ncbi:hypothetical protein HZS_1037 [Henneguya salminicola]|nr:hypothetical protein HZS_1037 [Henneguya salminicola]
MGISIPTPMHDLNCKKCGGSNFLEDSCELFCLDCGNMDKLTSNFSQSQDVVKVAWSLSIKEGPQNTSKLPDSENPFDNLDILNILMKSYSRSLSHLLDCQELHEYIGRLWITYVHQITKQSDTETNCNESRVKKRLYFNPSKYLLLKICFIAIKSLGLVFTYCDLKKIIIENKISYYKWKPELSDINVPKNSKKSLRNDFLPPGDQFYSVSAKLAGYIGHATPKTLDLDSFIFKFIHDLNFSKSIHSIAHALNQIWFENFTKTSRCKFPFNKLYIFSEIYAMALVILSARMYFYSSWVETPIGLKSGRYCRIINLVRTIYVA